MVADGEDDLDTRCKGVEPAVLVLEYFGIRAHTARCSHGRA